MFQSLQHFFIYLRHTIPFYAMRCYVPRLQSFLNKKLLTISHTCPGAKEREEQKFSFETDKEKKKETKEDYSNKEMQRRDVIGYS